MKVVMTVPSLAREFGGPAAKAAHLSSSLRDLGAEVTLVGCGAAPDALGLPTIGRVHATPVPRTVAPLKAAIGVSEVVHILGYRDPVGTAAARMAQRSGVPYMVEPLGMFGPKLRSARMKAVYEIAFGRRLMAGAATVIATSAVEARDLNLGGLDGTNIQVRPNGVSVDSLLPLPERGVFRERLGIPEAAPLVLTISRLSITKGLPGLARSAARMNGAYFVIAGPDDRDGTRQELTRLSAMAGSPSRLFVLADGLWGYEKASAIADADIFCLPSATESFGIAAAEAAALGLPIVLSDRCGGVEWLDDGCTRVFAFGDDDDLLRALKDVIDNNDIRARAKEAAPNIRARLDWAAVAKQQLAMYRSVIGSAA